MSHGSGGPTGRGPRGEGRGPGPTRRGAPAPSAAEFAGVGLQLAATIVIFAFGGIWLDRRLGTSPWLVLLGVFVGAGTGFYSIYRKLMAAQRRGDGTGGGAGDGGAG